jgi:hypothetical protein
MSTILVFVTLVFVALDLSLDVLLLFTEHFLPGFLVYGYCGGEKQANF